MREIFIHRMNALSGFNPETGENPGQSEHFFKAQEDIQRLRKLIQQHSDRAVKKYKGGCPPIWVFGMVMYQRYVENGLSFKALLKTSFSKHFSKAVALDKELNADAPELTPEEIQAILERSRKGANEWHEWS